MSRAIPSRFRPASLAIIATCLVALTACADDGDTAANDDTADLLPAAEGTTAYPLTLETDYGQTTLEERPERIAVIGGLGDQESVLALDITPVIGSDDTAYEWLDETGLSDIDEFIDPWSDTLSVETILAAEPDLIVASTYGNIENEYDELAKIAPVLVIESTGDYAWDWRELIRSVGEATDLTELAEQQITVTEQSIADAQAAHPEYAGHSVSIITNRGQESGIQFVNTHGSPAQELLTQLGFTEPAQIDELSSFEWGEISIENLGLIDADALIVARHGGDGSLEEATAWLEGSPLYQSLPVVQADNVAYIDPSESTGDLELAWAFSYPNVLANRWAVTELTNALDGIFG